MSSQMGTPTRMPLDRHRPRGRTAREQALFVEYAVVRQVRLVAQGGDAALIEQRAGIIELAILDPGRADQHPRSSARGLTRQLLDGGAAGRLERGLEHQVFRRIAADEQFGQHQQIGAVGLGLVARGARLGGITRDVADRRVQLRQCDRKGWFGHGAMVPRTRANCKCSLRSVFERSGYPVRIAGEFTQIA